MRDILNSIWSLLGSAPLWLKIMGIVVFPLLLVISALFLFIRQVTFLSLQENTNPEIIAALNSLLTRELAFSLGIAILIGVGLAYLLSSILIHPLHELLTVIQRLERGDLTGRVAVWADDEIGRVQKAFNRMTAHLEKTQIELHERNRELTVVNELTGAISGEHRANEIIESALASVLKLTDADVASIYLLDQSGRSLILQSLKGKISDPLLKQARRREMTTSPMQRIVVSGRAYSLSGLNVAPELPAELRQMLTTDGLQAWAGAPIKVHGKTIGVLNLLSRRERSFEPEDRVLLESIGSVIGVSLINARLVESLEEKEIELRRALHRSVQVQEEERKRLSRELHDEAGQALTSILIRLKTLQEETDIDTIHDRVNGIRYLAAETIEELRRLAMDLRPAALDNLGIMPALRWYIGEFSRHTDIEVNFHGEEKVGRLPPEIELVLYRVAQEGLTNALRHGQANKIEVSLQRGSRSVWLSILDNGRGFDPQAMNRGLGLVGVQERVQSLGGTFGVEASPGEGTNLWIEIPLNERVGSDADQHEHSTG